MNEATQKRQTENAKERQRLINAAKRVFASEDGQRVLAHLETTFRVNERVFTPVRSGPDLYAYDAITAALTDGGRAVIIEIKRLLDAPSQGDANIEEPTLKVTKQ
ncbi:hypothetical protein TSACC_21701 [Terrimicrobium sacchariphilum]|uniref:Bbp19-like phage domain-containing protein n=1 Tax=Terrimicrobium sacchariphilum TaxID=690879 RepID=A0A146G9E9_TERSA|nr:hypothetical protein [Terrimicrobium sacchariphilum]GAT33288.1 hypothetical protein TSACC_21701 [Terrimicrobium sacchariphilum]